MHLLGYSFIPYSNLEIGTMLLILQIGKLKLRTFKNLPKITLAMDWPYDEILIIRGEFCCGTLGREICTGKPLISVPRHCLLDMILGLQQSSWDNYRSQPKTTRQNSQNDRAELGKNLGSWWCCWAAELTNPQTSDFCFSHFEIYFLLLVTQHILTNTT